MEDTTPIPVRVIRETDKAYLLRDDSEENEAWFPKSQISWKQYNPTTKQGIADIPDWLLVKAKW